MSDLSADLRALAEAYGVATEFWDWQGRHTPVPRDTVLAVLAALDVDASTEQGARAALADAERAPWRRTLPPVVVTRSGRGAEVPVHVPHGEPVELSVELEDGGTIDLEQQQKWVDPREVDGALVGEATFTVPTDLPLGWHRLRADRPGAEPVRSVLVVTPDVLTPRDRLGRPRWGVMAQLYSLRSTRSWAHGDLEDLAELARWGASDHGADFVLVNPLHAPSPTTPIEPSPYLPVTRRFASPLYIRIEQIPEIGYLNVAARTEIERSALVQRALAEADVLLDRDAVWTAKREALAQLHAVRRSPAREADYQAFLVREGEGLRDFATWCALAEVHGAAWSRWPEKLRRPDGPAVAAARAELADRVDFFCWLQWVLDEQLAAAQGRAVDAGMELGIVHDLAVGVHPDGADTWSLQDVMASGVTVGAPPDAFNQLGQDWSQPPWRPDRLAAAGYLPYRDMLRTVLRHSGGIRVDHVIGLFRLWWVPDGSSPADGTYVRFDHDALVGILALEAQRAGAVVIGEDLGTVEPWVRDYLAERGVLGTSILWFEREEGRPKPPDSRRQLCLATVTTHDLPPTSGYLQGEHIRVRERLGLLTRDIDDERRVDAQDQRTWLDLLVERGWLADDAQPAVRPEDVPRTVVALHRALGATPSLLRGVSLNDLVGDRRTINQPGTSTEYPNWCVPMSDAQGRPVLLERLAASRLAAEVSAALRASGRD
jgi:4-alpha-glucanotransferase